MVLFVVEDLTLIKTGLQVEDILFRMLRGMFEQSEAFHDMFQLSQPEGSIVDGADDDHPLHLEGYL
jgi:hypothetical protein